jgi:molecular chaperone GrpE
MSKKKNKEELVEKETDLEQEMEEAERETEKTSDNPEKHPDRIQELEASVIEWKDKYLRAMAEFDNYRKRSLEEKTDWIKRASEKLALAVCDVLDNFDRALLQLSEQQKEDNFIKGIMLIDQQLKGALEREGVKRINALGKDFDPKLHEALAHIPSEMEEGKIAAIIQNGYTMNEKLIRPVRVAVSSGISEQNENLKSEYMEE